MRNKATVVSVEHDKVILSCSTSACAGCKGKMFCNINQQLFEAVNTQEKPLKPGTVVEVYLNPKKTVAQSFSMLIFPLLLFVAGYVVATQLFLVKNELWQALGGFAGLGIGFFLAFLYNKRKKGLGRAEIVGVYDHEPAE